MSNREDSEHLANLSDGAGCAEVWEHLSEQREADAEADEEHDAESTTDAEVEETAEADDDAPEQDAAAVPCP